MAAPDHDPEDDGPWETPPWELPGACRLDAQPHRGTLLRRLANATFLAAVVSCYPFLCCCVGRPLTHQYDFALVVLSGPGAILGLVVAGSGIGIWRLARRDLDEMRAGGVDPNGQPETNWARRRALLGLSIGLVSCMAWGGWALVVWLQ